MLGRGKVAMKGSVGMKVIRRGPRTNARGMGRWTFLDVLRASMPWFGQAPEVRRWRFRNFWRLLVPAFKVGAANLLGIAYLVGSLDLTVIRANGEQVHYGLAGMKLVTDAGVDFIVDAFQDSTELELLKFHGIGTGSTAEAQTETALVTELTTEYNPDNTRATGSTIEGASTNIYRTVGTNAVDAAALLREHGIFTQAATGGGTMLDRTLYALITLASGDSLQSTYDLTVSAGG